MLDTVRDWYRSTFGHALLSAVLLWAALPPADLWPLAWVAPVWWVLLVRRQELSGSRPYLKIWVAGFLFWIGALHWMRLPHWMTGFGWVALSFYLAFYVPAFVGLSRVAVHRLRVPVILAAPVVWTGLELVRGHLLTGFTMASLGHTQYRWIELIQLSDLAGAYGVGFVVMLVAACLARMVSLVPAEEQLGDCPDFRAAKMGRSPSETGKSFLGRSFNEKPWAWWPLLPAAGVVCATLLYGHLRVSREPGESQARIALIQGSIDVVLDPPPGTHDRMHKQYRELSEKAVAQYGDLDLIIWPETVFGRALRDYAPGLPVPDDWKGSEAGFRLAVRRDTAKSRKPMRDLANELGTPLLIGVTTEFFDVEHQWKRFNSAAFVPLGEGAIRCYHKMHLVVFGEYVPFGKHFPWVHRLMPMSMVLSAGTRPAAFELGPLRVSPNICYETVIPHVIRRQVNTLKAENAEPDVLVNLTNDGWFWGSSELDMHLACGVFRAVECRKPLLIAANTGFSAWIDADGRILAKGPRRAKGILLAEVAVDRRSSWYLTYGDWPAAICLAACLLFAAVGVWDRCRARSEAQMAGTPPSTGQARARGAVKPRRRAGRARR